VKYLAYFVLILTFAAPAWASLHRFEPGLDRHEPHAHGGRRLLCRCSGGGHDSSASRFSDPPPLGPTHSQDGLAWSALYG
jgi:hypothetical protein